RRNHDDRNGVVDERDGAVLQFSACVALRMDIRQFLELKSALECQWVAGAPPEIEHIPTPGEVTDHYLDFLLQPQRIDHQPRHVDQRLYKRSLLRSRNHAASRPAVIAKQASTAS